MSKEPEQIILLGGHTEGPGHMKGCSASLAIRDMQIETTMRYHLTPLTMAIRNKSIDKKWWQGCGEKGTLVQCWWECGVVRPLWKTVWNFLRKLKMELFFHPVISLLELYPKNPETPIQNNLCTPTFIAAQFTSAGSSLSAYQWMIGSKSYDTFTQCNTTQQRERRSSYPSQHHAWNWRALCQVK